MPIRDGPETVKTRKLTSVKKAASHVGTNAFQKDPIILATESIAAETNPDFLRGSETILRCGNKPGSISREAVSVCLFSLLPLSLSLSRRPLHNVLHDDSFRRTAALLHA